MGEFPIATTEEIRQLDRVAIAQYGIPGIVLMENAGRGAAAVALRMLGEKRGRVLVICGRGNNGGDGFVVARHLYNRGLEVQLWVATPIVRIEARSDAGINLAIVRKMRLPLQEMTDPPRIPAIKPEQYALIVDAMLGTGASGEVRDPMRRVIQLMNDSGVPILAVDIPSGLDADSGRVLGVAVRATCTATFAAAKRGFYLGDGPAHVGKLLLVDIGIPRELLAKLPRQV